MEKGIIAFKGKNIRRIWFAERWFFSVVDVVGALTDSEDPRNYWKVLKSRLIDEGSEVVTFCNQLKLTAEQGKLRKKSSRIELSTFCRQLKTLAEG